MIGCRYYFIDNLSFYFSTLKKHFLLYYFLRIIFNFAYYSFTNINLKP